MAFEPVGRRGIFGFEQITKDGSTYTWIPTRQRWELSGGTAYNERVNTTPQQAMQNTIRLGGTPKEAQDAFDNQVNILTNPTRNYLFGASVLTGDGVVIRDVQSERGALEQIIQKTDKTDPRQESAIKELKKTFPLPETDSIPQIPLPAPNKPVIINDNIVEIKTIKPSPSFEEFKNVQLKSTSQLIVGPGIFEFILDFGNGKFYTTKRFKIQLEKAEREENPYFNLRTAPIIKLDGRTLSNHGFKNKFRIGELYSEVNITKSIITPEEMMLHIDWLCSSGKEFRNTEVGKTITSNGRQYNGIGSWEVNHNPNGNLGFEWEDFIKLTKEDKEFAEQQFSNSIQPKAVNITRPDEVTSSSSVSAIIAPGSTEPTFPPFDTAGTPGERRTHDGSYYFWSPQQNKWRRDDSLNLQDKELILQATNPPGYVTYQALLNDGDFATGDRDQFDSREEYDNRERYIDQIIL